MSEKENKKIQPITTPTTTSLTKTANTRTLQKAITASDMPAL
jgi:hypothetical protein